MIDRAERARSFILILTLGISTVSVSLSHDYGYTRLPIVTAFGNKVLGTKAKRRYLLKSDFFIYFMMQNGGNFVALLLSYSQTPRLIFIIIGFL